MASIPARMRAVTFNGFGGPEVLRLAKMETPQPKHGEVLIAVVAAGVNRPDVLQRLGHYPPPLGAPDWPGLEVAGTVAALGEGTRRFRLGDAVMALLPGGGYADFAVADEGSVLPIPAGLDSVEAAAFPETGFTVWHNVFQRGALTPGEALLVHGGTSGIGTIAIQLGAALGARVFATVGSFDKADAARRLGAPAAVNYREEDFVAGLRAATGGRGADVILDMVGGDYVDRNCQAAAPDARIVQIAFLRGRQATIDLSRVMQKRLTLTGSTLRARSSDFKAALAREVEARVFPLVAAGVLRPVIDRVLPLNQAAEAHRRLDADHVGKIVLRVAADA